MAGPVDFDEAFERLKSAGQKEETTRMGGVAVRLVRVEGGGPGSWGSHDDTPETVVVWSGDFRVEFRDRTLDLGPGGCCVVATGEEHRGTSKDGAEVVLFQNVA